MTGYLRTAVLVVSLSMAGCATGPSRDMTLSDEGYNAMAAGDMQRAENLLTEAVAANPDNAYALINLGALYQNTNRPELARPLYLHVIAAEADNQKAAVTPEQREDVARLVQLARDNLALMYREEVAQQEAAAPEPEAVPEPMPLVEAPAPAPKAPVEFDYWIQIGAFASRANAEQLGSRFMERHGGLVRDKEVHLAQRNGVTKVQVGPYGNMTEANNACRALKRAGVNCFPGKR